MRQKYATECFNDYRKERSQARVKECPVCSDLYHGYLDGFHDGQKQLEQQLKKANEENKIMRDALEFVAGVDSIDHWIEQFKIYTKDQIVEASLNDIKKCKQALKKINEDE